jgi:hypothetical protein
VARPGDAEMLMGDGVALEQLFRKLESGEIDAGDIL